MVMSVSGTVCPVARSMDTSTLASVSVKPIVNTMLSSAVCAMPRPSESTATSNGAPSEPPSMETDPLESMIILKSVLRPLMSAVREVPLLDIVALMEPTSMLTGTVMDSPTDSREKVILMSSMLISSMSGIEYTPDSTSMKAGPLPSMSVMDMVPEARSTEALISKVIPVISLSNDSNGSCTPGYIEDIIRLVIVPLVKGMSMLMAMTMALSVNSTWASASLSGPPLVTPPSMLSSPPSLMSMLKLPLGVSDIMSMSNEKSTDPSRPMSMVSVTAYRLPMYDTMDPGMRVMMVPEASRCVLPFTESTEASWKTSLPPSVKMRLFPSSS